MTELTTTTFNDVAVLRRAAQAAGDVGDNAAAIGHYSAALAALAGQSSVDPLAEYELHAGRAACYHATSDYPAEANDLAMMATLAGPLNDPRRQIAVVTRRATLDILLGNTAQARDAAEAALARARELGDAALEAGCLWVLGEAGFHLGRFDRAEACFRQALALYRGLGDRLGEARSLHSLGFTLGYLGSMEQARGQAEAALSMYRLLGQPAEQAFTLASLGVLTGNHAHRRDLLEEALQLTEGGGDRHIRSRIVNSLGTMYTRLGLYQRAHNYAFQAVELMRALQLRANLSWALDSLGYACLGLQAYDEANRVFDECSAMAAVIGDPSSESYAWLGLGRAALALGQPDKARALLHAAAEQFVALGQPAERANALAHLGAAQLALSDLPAALACTAEAAGLVDAGHISVDFPAQEAWWWHYQALVAAGDADAGWQAIQRAHALTLAVVTTLSDAGLRRSYFNKVATNRAILIAWRSEAGRRGVSAAAEEAPAADVQSQLTRMLAIGTRMNEQRDSAALQTFLLDELIELSGAERALLLLRAPDASGEVGDPGMLAAFWGLADRAAEDLRAWAAPTLSEAARTRKPVLRHDLPDALMVTDDDDRLPGLAQRSALAVPLVAGARLIGVLYADMRAIFGQFTAADLNLLAVLASQASTALENARLYEQTLRANRDLEHRVAERTADLEQRAAELTLINGVQQALASQLDMQAIFDLVGDKIRDIFDAQVVDIGIFDKASGLLHFPYWIERGVRYPSNPEALFGFRKHVIETRQPLLISDDFIGAGDEYGTPTVFWGEESKSGVFVPLVVGDEAKGYITIQDLDRERAFSDSDMRLLSTLSASMSVAIENARLFDETKRLLAETEQRSAELATVNQIGQALGAELELDALIALTGEQICQTFAADIAYVALFDRESNVIQFPYYYEHGTRTSDETMPYGHGLTSRIIVSGQPLLLNQQVEEFEAQTGILSVGPDAKSYLGVPILSGQQAIGVISVQSTQAEGRFGDTDVRLLTTIAANVGAAIQNARLFKETSRRANEMAALIEIGRDVSATLDLPTVLERIATHVMNLLHGRDVVLRLLEPDGRLPAVVALGKYAVVYKQWPVRLGYGLTGHIAQSGVAEIVNDPMGDPRVAPIPGTEADDPTEAMIYAPLLVGENVIGIMTAWRDKTVAGPFTQSDLDFTIGLARQAAIAIENARLFAEIQRQKQFSDALIDASPVAIIQEDLDEHVTSWNPAAEMLFGYTREEAIGRHIDDLVASQPEVRLEADHYTRATSLAQGGVSHHGIGRRTHKDGQLVDVEFFGVPVIVDGQEVAGINLYHNITELQKARQEAVAANEAKSAFLANMSHELRTPLNAVLGFAQLMERDPALAPRQKEHLGIITHSGEHLLNLINDVLEISKIEAGQVTLNQASFDLRALLRSVEELFRQRAESKQLRLRFEVMADVPQYVTGDESKLRQIVINLLGNAVKFTQVGQVTLRASWVNHQPSAADLARDKETRRQGDGLTAHLPVSLSPNPLVFQSSLLVEVEDTGVGIAAEQLPDLFQPFVQTASGIQAHEGTGLGLAITRQFVRLMGGDIAVTSAFGQGSVFRFHVRLTPLEQTPAPRLAERRVVGVVGGGAAYRMLVVDDKWENRRLLIEWLSAVGFAVREAANGAEAIAEWERWAPQLIWMDMRMPILDGYAATQRIKATLKGQATVIIALTASAFEHEQTIVLSAGCDDFVRKPVRESVVFEKIARHLGIQFIYAEQPVMSETAEGGAALRTALAALPPDWLAELKQAILMADMEQVKALARQIHGRDQVVADGIERLADNLRLDQLYGLIQA